MRIMIKLGALIVFSTALCGCSEPRIHTGYIENFDGEKVDAKKVFLDDWEVFTSDGGSFISLSKNGVSILYVTEDHDENGLGRMITIESEGQGIDLIDRDMDTTYETMELSTIDRSITDEGLDGEIDTLVEWNLDPIVVQVNYKGVLYPLLGDGLKTGTIIVNGEEVDLKREGFIWVPAETTHNKIKNENASKAGTDAAQERRRF